MAKEQSSQSVKDKEEQAFALLVSKLIDKARKVANGKLN